jgi:hypothetical protein
MNFRTFLRWTGIFVLSVLSLGGFAATPFSEAMADAGSICPINSTQTSGKLIAAQNVGGGNSNGAADRLAFVQQSTGSSQVVAVPCPDFGSGLGGTWNSGSEITTHIIVKASTVQELYDVNDGTSGPWSTNCIRNNGGNQPNISGIFCFRVGGQPSGNGTINVIKSVIGGTDTFNFKIKQGSSTQNNFALTPPVDGQDSQGFSKPAGTYKIEEENNSDFDSKSLECVSSNGDTFTYDGRKVEVDLSAGEAITCTFTNEKKRRNAGTIKIIKKTTGGNDDFSLTIAPGNLVVPITTSSGIGSSSPIVLDAAAGPNGTTYSVTETVTTGWTLTNASCKNEDDQTQGSRSGNAVTNIVLNRNENIICTFENKRDTGTIKIVKKTIGGNGTFNFTGGLSSDFSTLATNNGEATTQVLTKQAGKYVVTESELQGWKLTGLVCTGDTDNGSTTNLANRSVEIDLDASENIVCTFTNTKKGSLTIIKDAGGAANNGFEFTLTNLPDDTLKLTPPSEASKTYTDLLPGTYGVSETVLSGWNLKSATCDNGDNPANIDLNAGESIACTFVNERETGSLKVIKNTIGGQGDFNFSVTGPQNVPSFKIDTLQKNVNLLPSLETGTYTLTETNLPTGWTVKNIDCGSSGSNKTETSIDVTVSAGSQAVCTFTNFKKKDDKMSDVTKVFINRRVDNLLSHDPDRARVLRRLDESREESLKDGGSLEPLKITGSADGETTDVRISMSLSQLRRSARALQAKKEQEVEGFNFSDGEGAYISQSMASRWDFWIEGHISRYDDSTGGIDREGNFKILYLGADYAIAPGVLIGALVQIDRTDEDVKDKDLKGTVEGTGWMAGPYIGVRLRENLFFDARAAWGTSENEIDLTDLTVSDGRRTGEFDTDRWLASATLTGNYMYGNLRVSPMIGVAYGNEGNDEYLNSIGQTVDGSDITIGRLTFGPEFGYRMVREDGTIVEPHLSIKGIWNFDQTDLELTTGSVTPHEFRGQIEGGVIMRLPNGMAMRAAGSYDGIGDDDLEAWSAKAWLNIPLN